MYKRSTPAIQSVLRLSNHLIRPAGLGWRNDSEFLNLDLIEMFVPKRELHSCSQARSFVQPSWLRLKTADLHPMSYQLPPIAECTGMLNLRHCLCPLGQEGALHKLRAAEDRWNTDNQLRVPHAYAYAIDGDWQPHAEFVSDQQELVAFLIRKWTKELGGRLMRELWAWPGAKTAIDFALEWLAGAGTWIRSSRNENEKFGANGLTKFRLVSVSAFPINKPDRMMGWDRSGPRAAHDSEPFHFSSPTSGELKSKRRPE